MWVLWIVLSLAVLYLLAGAAVGMMNAKWTDEQVRKLESEGKSPEFIRGYKLGSFKTAMLKGPIIYLKAFFSLD